MTIHKLLIWILLVSISKDTFSQGKHRITQFGDTLIHNNFPQKSSFRTLTSIAEFTEISTPINGINLGSAEWIDYDSDGLIDIFINGFKIGDGDITHATIFRNQGNNSFSEVDITSFTRTIYGDQDWGDYNNDGHMDLILTGTSSGFNSENITEIHKNLGNDTFVEVSHNLPRISRSDVHWEDLDSDGDLDIFLMGLDQNLDFIARVYINVGDDVFEEGPNIFSGGSGRINFNNNASIWADFDNDGDIDGVLGYSTQTGGYGVKLFENKGSLNFTEKNTQLPQLNYVELNVFDFNNDDLIDIAISGNKVASTGSNSEIAYMIVLQNMGELQFEEHYNEATGAYWGSIECADYNNDGFSDVLINGNGNNKQGTYILENNQGNDFTYKDFDLTSTHFGGAHWGKLNNDNKLDIYIHGTTSGSSSDATSKIFKNNTTESNTPPSSPNNLEYEIRQDTLYVFWDKSLDDKTGLSGIFYNVELGSNPTTFNIISGQSTEIGIRARIKIGNNGMKSFFKFPNLDNGTHYFRVQAIDNSFSSSTYSEVLEICNPRATLQDSLSICQSDSVLLDPGAFDTYYWNNGEVSQTIYAKEEGWYTVEVENSFGCSSRDSTYVSINPVPTPSLIDLTISENDFIEVDPGEFSSYKWSNGFIGRILQISADSLTIGENYFSVSVVDSNGCSTKSDFIITVEKVLSNKPPQNKYCISVTGNRLKVSNLSSKSLFLWQVASLDGKIHFRSEKISSNEQTVFLNHGVYVVRIIDQQGVKTFKIFIK